MIWIQGNITESGVRQMSVSQAIVVSRKARKLSQRDLHLPYAQSMISMIEKGKRQIAQDVAPQLAETLDHPALYFEIAREMTGGFGPIWLNGPHVDLHRSSVREKTQEELREASDAIGTFTSSRPPAAETEQDRKKRYEHLIQVLDAVEACYMYIGVQCEEYGFSMKELHRDHYSKLKGKRYVTA